MPRKNSHKRFEWWRSRRKPRRSARSGSGSRAHPCSDPSFRDRLSRALARENYESLASKKKSRIGLLGTFCGEKRRSSVFHIWPVTSNRQRANDRASVNQEVSYVALLQRDIYRSALRILRRWSERLGCHFSVFDTHLLFCCCYSSSSTGGLKLL